MKSIFLSIVYPLLFLLCASCNNSRDFGNGYMLQDANREHIYTTRINEGKEKIIIDQQIVAWQRSGNSILVLRKIASSPDCLLENGQTTILTYYTSIDEYWMINPKVDEIIGPIKRSDFNLRTKSFGLIDVNLVVPPNYRDNTKEFKKAAVGCNEHR